MIYRGSGDLTMEKYYKVSDVNTFVTCDNRSEDVFILEDFAKNFFDRVIEGVCNVIKTA